MNYEDHRYETSGQIQLIMGPMFSGKTTELLRRIRRYTVAKRRCLVIKYAADKRYSDECAATHDSYTHSAVSASKLFEAISTIDLATLDVIGVDEGQFYPDLVEFSESMANQGKVVIVSALDGTFQRKPFGAVLELIPLAERVDKFSAVCMCCQNSAAFTSRLGTETCVELIGGTDLYISTCRQCFPVASKLYLQSRSPSTTSVSAPSSPVSLPGSNAAGGSPLSISSSSSTTSSATDNSVQSVANKPAAVSSPVSSPAASSHTKTKMASLAQMSPMLPSKARAGVFVDTTDS